MKMYDLITKKKLGIALNSDEIEFIVQGYNKGNIPDYQMSALLMAIYFNGMSLKESTDLTIEMVRSGKELSLDFPFLVDKHSTGGVADTTSLIVAPILAAAGCTVAKMSGRGLGHTGGTIDKLESFPGFSTSLSNEQFIRQLKEIKLAIIGQTENLAPVDKKIYALRDVTATVNSIPLIASSIMSKKLAAGADTIVLDVKCGHGAFMETLEDAKELASTMVSIGKRANKKVVAIISDMNNPLGKSIGNILEVVDSIEVLKGKYISRLSNLSETIVTEALLACNKVETKEEAANVYKDLISTGKALNKYKEFVNAQGGDASYFEDLEKFPKAKNILDIKADSSGFIHSIDALPLGEIAMELGAGRYIKDEQIDLTAGIKIHKHVGDKVSKDDLIATLYTNKNISSMLIDRTRSSFKFGDKKLKEKLIYEIIK
jgi:pyrimidine-nucleoside phosphorylase